LAKKLKDCGVFGVSSDEYLNYAEESKSEDTGLEVVAGLVKETSKLLRREAATPAVEFKL
jgi:hypothetical protein